MYTNQHKAKATDVSSRETLGELSPRMTEPVTFMQMSAFENSEEKQNLSCWYQIFLTTSAVWEPSECGDETEGSTQLSQREMLVSNTHFGYAQTWFWTLAAQHLSWDNRWSSGSHHAPEFHLYPQRSRQLQNTEVGTVQFLGDNRLNLAPVISQTYACPLMLNSVNASTAFFDSAHWRKAVAWLVLCHAENNLLNDCPQLVYHNDIPSADNGKSMITHYLPTVAHKPTIKAHISRGTVFFLPHL